jgi:hypothetical protein
MSFANRIRCALLLSAIPAYAVQVTNVTTATTLFRDNFESGTFSPSPGSWNVGPDVTVTNAALPGPAEGAFYASLFRNSDTNNQGNLRANFAAQTTAGNTIVARLMVYIPSGASNIDARMQLMLDNGDFNTARAWARPDGAGNVDAIGPGFAVTDTGLNYLTDTWQEWVLTYDINAATFSVSVNGVSAGGFSSTTSGDINRLEVFNGSPAAGTIFIDAVPETAVAPEPSALLLAGLGLAALRLRRAERR